MTSIALKNLPVAILVGGGIGSGKTTVARLLTNTLQCAAGSFGEIVRAETRSRNLPASREYLQKTGEELVRERPRHFCRLVLDQADWDGSGPLVVDGLRHADLLPIMQDLVAPTNLIFVFLDATPAVRTNRVVARGDESSDLRALDRHTTEAQVQGHLRKHANLVLDGAQNADTTCRLIVEYLAQNIR